MPRGHPKGRWPGECDPGCPEPAQISQGMRTGEQNGAARKGTEQECTAFAEITRPPRQLSHAPPSLTPHPHEPGSPFASPSHCTGGMHRATVNGLAGTYKMLPLRRPERVVAQGVAAVAVLGRGGEIVRGLVVNPRQGPTFGAVKGASEAHEWCQLEEHLNAHRPSRNHGHHHTEPRAATLRGRRRCAAGLLRAAGAGAPTSARSTRRALQTAAQLRLWQLPRKLSQSVRARARLPRHPRWCGACVLVCVRARAAAAPPARVWGVRSRSHTFFAYGASFRKGKTAGNTRGEHVLFIGLERSLSGSCTNFPESASGV
jgi:hypothetical protein